MSLPELHVVEDVPATFAAIARARLDEREGTFRFACSGGSAGRAGLEALVRMKIDWSRVELFQVDERCVPADDPDSNAGSLAEVLGEHRNRLAGFHAMSCEAGPASYEAEISAVGGTFDLVQLGMGPDGHTASLFPSSPALEAPEDRLVVMNHDPSGTNPHERMTLTYAGIARGELVVVTAFGAAKHEPLARIFAGEDLPAARLSAPRLVWLVDAAAAGDLPTTALPEDLAQATTR